MGPRNVLGDRENSDVINVHLCIGLTAMHGLYRITFMYVTTYLFNQIIILFFKCSETSVYKAYVNKLNLKWSRFEFKTLSVLFVCLFVCFFFFFCFFFLFFFCLFFVVVAVVVVFFVLFFFCFFGGFFGVFIR